MADWREDLRRCDDSIQKKIIKSRVNIFNSKESSPGPFTVLFILILLILEEHLIDYKTDSKAALPAFFLKKIHFHLSFTEPHG